MQQVLDKEGSLSPNLARKTKGEKLKLEFICIIFIICIWTERPQQKMQTQIWILRVNMLVHFF